jgi:CheY-like chemotaxis protein
MLKLLVVDDNPADIDLLRDAFAELNIAVDLTTAADGLEALGVLEHVVNAASAAPAGILLDLNMPQMHGRDVLTFIKSTPRLAHIPTIVVTSSASPHDRRDCMKLGADAYFTKPGTLEGLNELIRGVEQVIKAGPSRSGVPPTPPFAPGQLMRSILGAWRALSRIRSGVSCSP